MQYFWFSLQTLNIAVLAQLPKHSHISTTSHTDSDCKALCEATVEVLDNGKIDFGSEVS